jgi:exonuclease SbcD
MKFLHTADWHLGRQFEGHSLDDDHALVLDQIFTALQTHKPDALIIAGDIFDRAAPPETAVRLFNTFIERTIAETQSAIVIIAGNHDSADRIGAMAMLADRRRALVRGPLSATELPLILHDAHGPVAISALPFGYEYAAREAFGDPAIKSPADVMRAEVAAARPHIPAGARWIIVAHAFVTGAAPSTTERPLTRIAGGIETVPADVFDGAHYVALGHIHRPQTAGAPHIRYSGSPLAFAFDEEGNEKSYALVDLAADGTTAVDIIPFRPRRTVRTLKGTLEDILRLPPSDDFVTVVLTDDGRLIEPMKRIRERFPFACGLSYARDLKSRHSAPSKPAATSLDDPATVATEFLTHMRSTPPTPAEAHIIAGALARLTTADEDAAA